ncbi:hypothetical protein V473_19700 [Sphingobium cupriresistens LL01]|uniref:Uncharacterized protein n=1 Tax=Sphingobium cupriresistens LL01 TaxID=1420583 RepID=A0A0J7XQN3_9SPHN|nr:hypothetical protein V473_19700 [Sphingobium cupriresistens LL01]
MLAGLLSTSAIVMAAPPDIARVSADIKTLSSDPLL